jgi:hypothetical protein
LLRKAFLVLLEDAAAGDKGAAKLVGPWLNQGLGMPTETVVQLPPVTAEDIEAMPTGALVEMVRERRTARRQAADAALSSEQTG